MLNCTDLACVLHHHHFYAHLHHLKRHLDGHHDHHDEEDEADEAGGDVDSNNITDLLNEPDSELSSLSHVEQYDTFELSNFNHCDNYNKSDYAGRTKHCAGEESCCFGSRHTQDDPNNVWYIICGVIIAMVLVGIIIILVAVTISKLRKREESSHVVNNSEATQPTHVVSTVEPVGFRQSPSSVWHFPPLPPQPNLYIYNASSQDALVHHNDKMGLRGFRKQLSGRFKRLVSRKSHEPTPVIPPELKPQLKTIYVY